MAEEKEESLPELEAPRDNATENDFKTKNKVYDLMLYINPELEQFRAHRGGLQTR